MNEQSNQNLVEEYLSRKICQNGKEITLKEIFFSDIPSSLCIEKVAHNINNSKKIYNSFPSGERHKYLQSLKNKNSYYVNDIKVPKYIYDWAQVEIAKYYGEDYVL